MEHLRDQWMSITSALVVDHDDGDRVEGFLPRPGFKYPLVWIVERGDDDLFYWATISQGSTAVIAKGGPCATVQEAMDEIEARGAMKGKQSSRSLDDAVEELAKVLLSAPSKPVNLWGDLPERQSVDWAKKLRGVEYVYRGLGVRHLSPGDADLVFDDTVPLAYRAAHVLGLVRSGVGMHWSTHRGEAAGFAGMAADRGDLRVILTARPPRLDDIVTDADELHRNQVFDPDSEGEIPVRPGVRLSLVTIEWAPGGPRPMLKSDDGGGWIAASLSRTITAASSNAQIEVWVDPGYELARGGWASSVNAVARVGGQPVGFLRAETVDRSGEIVRVWVNAEHRRKGIATEMLRAAEREIGFKLDSGHELSISGAPWAESVTGRPARPTYRGEGEFGYMLNQYDRESPSKKGH